MPTLFALQGSVLAAANLAGPEQVNTAPLAQVEIRHESSNAIAVLFEDVDGTTGAGNPVICDSAGEFLVYAEAGTYRIQITAGARVKVLRHYVIGNTADAAAAAAEAARVAAEAALEQAQALFRPADQVITIQPDETVTITGDAYTPTSHITYLAVGQRDHTSPAVVLAPGARCDDIRMIIPTAGGGANYLELKGGNRLGRVKIASEVQLNRTVAANGGLWFTGNDIEMGDIEIRNLDRCMSGTSVSGIRLGNIRLTNYQRGVHWLYCSDIQYRMVTTRGRSIYAEMAPGRGAIHIGDSIDITGGDLDLEGSTEHAIYISSGAGQGAKRIKHGAAKLSNCGMSGLKIKSAVSADDTDGGNGVVPDLEEAENVSFTSIEVAGTGKTQDPEAFADNADAVRIERCNGFFVPGGVWCHKGAEIEPYAAVRGMHFNGVRDAVVGPSMLEHCLEAMVYVRNKRAGNNGITLQKLSGHSSKFAVLIEHLWRDENGDVRALRDMQIIDGIVWNVTDGAGGGRILKVSAPAAFAPASSRSHIVLRYRTVDALVENSADADIRTYLTELV